MPVRGGHGPRRGATPTHFERRGDARIPLPLRAHSEARCLEGGGLDFGLGIAAQKARPDVRRAFCFARNVAARAARGRTMKMRR